MGNLRLPAEWEPQKAVQIAWPHADTDWNPYLSSVEECYCNIAREISLRQDLIIVTPEPEHVRQMLHKTASVKMGNIHIAEIPTNDTWARDHAFLTMTEGKMAAEASGSERKALIDLCFNGWGQKFASNYDNQINSRIFSWLSSYLPGEVSYSDCRRIVLEGGSVESDGKGTILTTSSCLMAPNRNYYATKAEAEQMLKQVFGASRILWLNNSWLDGDDTDGHIDTVARLCPDDTIVYVKCYDEADEHYEGLSAMERELQALRTPEGMPYRLLPVPLPSAVFERDFEDCVEEEKEQRLPATYANFLIINKAVLMPTYGQPENDAKAIAILQQAFPDREIIGIDCRVLIRQHGSLHCITMQYPL